MQREVDGTPQAELLECALWSRLRWNRAIGHRAILADANERAPQRDFCPRRVSRESSCHTCLQGAARECFKRCAKRPKLRSVTVLALIPAMKLFLRFTACAVTILVASAAAALAWDRSDQLQATQQAADPHAR